ncbi:MAG TPA: DAK2 domain-containing protein [Chloroflexia bacterium]|nr:DAK2 domain-containing protein [Chloroflexia bacterium]
MQPRGGVPASVPVGDLLQVAAATMQQERGRLNALSSFGGEGTHGDRMARAFRDAAYAVHGSGTGDAGEDLQLAGQVLMDPTSRYGRAAVYLGQGLAEAGKQFIGQTGVSLADLVPLLTGLLAGAQQGDAAAPGQGTLIDVLIPAVTAYTNAASQGLTYQQSIQGMLGAAMAGVRNTANMPQPHTPRPKQAPGQAAGQPDPGAATTQTFLTGLVQGLLGDRVPPTPPGQSNSNFLLNLLQQGIDLGGVVVRPPPVNAVESLLGATAAAGRYEQGFDDVSPGYGKGTDIRTDGGV